MKKLPLSLLALILGLFFQMNSFSQKPNPIAPAQPPAHFKHAMANVNGIRIHYVIGGAGAPLVLVHGFGENWYFWHRLLPELSKHFTVIAPDLRGLGESDKPDGGYDKKTMSSDIHELVKQLGYPSISLVGHDIGLMVAYSYAAQFPTEVSRLVLMDALIPGVEPLWTDYEAKAWWWGFFSWHASGQLIEGKEGFFLTNFWAEQGFIKDAFTKQESDEFIRAYSVPGSAVGSFKWFAAFPKDVEDNKILTQQKLPMPVLAMSGDHHKGLVLADHVRMIASQVQESKIRDAGHWLTLEQTAQVQQALLDFLLVK